MNDVLNPKISLLMAVYNGAAALAPSIESILQQTYTDFELVLVNDGSTDETASVIASYAARDARVRVVTNEKNIGLTASLNVGIRVARGTYLARMDAGDLSESTRFEKQVAFLDTHPTYGLLGSWAKVINEHGTEIGTMTYPTEDAALRKVMIWHNPFVHSSVMIRRTVLETAGLYDERWKYAQDYELFFRLAKVAHIALIGEYLVSYRMYPQSITSRKNKQQTLFALKARLKAIQEGQYGIGAYRALLGPFLAYLLPYRVKRYLKKLV